MKNNNFIIIVFTAFILCCIICSGCGIADTGTICFEENKNISEIPITERDMFMNKAGCTTYAECIDKNYTVKYENCTDYYVK